MTTTTETKKPDNMVWKDHRAATNPAWVFFFTGLVSPIPFLIAYAIRQRCWAYINILVVAGAIFFTLPAGEDGLLDKRTKYGMQMGAGAAAALVAYNNKKSKKEEEQKDD